MHRGPFTRRLQLITPGLDDDDDYELKVLQRIIPSLLKMVPDNLSLRHDVSMETCQAIAGGWEAGGSAKNTGKATTTYLITVYFTDTQATVVGYAQTHVKVAPGQSANWTASAQFAAPAKTRCVLSGVG